MRIFGTIVSAIAVAIVPVVIIAQAPARQPPAPQGGAPGVTLPRLPQAPLRDGAPQPQSATGTASLRGRIVRADTGAPLPRVSVSITGGTPNDSPTVLTDDRGAYQIGNLAAGRYTVRATKTGFVTMSYGQRNPARPIGTSIELADRQAADGIDLSLPPGGVIEGLVFDEFGEPVAAAAVQLVRRQYSNGERRMAAENIPLSTTDDQGHFRLYGIAAGAHYVSVTVSGPQAAPRPLPIVGLVGSPSPTFYPATISAAEAQPITLAAGQQVSGITIQASSAQLATISGSVRSASGRPIGAGSIQLAVSSSSRGTGLRPDGSFSFPNMPPGQYTISVRLTDLKESASAQVTLNGSDVSVPLVSRAGATIRGKFVFDGGSPGTLMPASLRPTLQSGGAALSPLMASSDLPKTNDDWTFELTGVTGTGLLRYTALNSAPSGQPSPWTLKGVFRRGADITDSPISITSDIDDVEIVLTQKINVVTGIVTDRAGKPVAEGTVVVFADDPQRWVPRTRFIGSNRMNSTGVFTVRALPPGRYLAIAVDFLEPGDEQDPDILETLRAKATPLTLGEGEMKTLDLKLIQE